jgi:hypothetical protein
MRAVDAERLRRMDHHRVRLFRLLDVRGIARWQRGLADDARDAVVQQVGRERVVRQRGQVDDRGGPVLPCIACRCPARHEPDGVRHGLAAMAGVAGDAGLGDVGWLMLIARTIWIMRRATTLV